MKLTTKQTILVTLFLPFLKHEMKKKNKKINVYCLNKFCFYRKIPSFPRRKITRNIFPPPLDVIRQEEVNHDDCCIVYEPFKLFPCELLSQLFPSLNFYISSGFLLFTTSRDFMTFSWSLPRLF